MKQLIKYSCFTTGALCVLFSSWSASADVQFLVVGEGPRQQPVEKHFFDLYTPTSGEQAQANTTGSLTQPQINSSSNISGGAELTQEDKKLLVTEEESKQIELTPDKLATAELAIKEKVVEKYKLQIDGIIVRLQERVAAIPEPQQGIILKSMQNKVASKKPAVIESKQIDTLRKDVLIEILDYIVQSLEPPLPTPPAPVQKPVL